METEEEIVPNVEYSDGSWNSINSLGRLGMYPASLTILSSPDLATLLLSKYPNVYVYSLTDMLRAVYRSSICSNLKLERTEKPMNTSLDSQIVLYSHSTLTLAIISSSTIDRYRSHRYHIDDGSQSPQKTSWMQDCIIWNSKFTQPCLGTQRTCTIQCF